VSLQADRGFLHAELIRWVRCHGWTWTIRGKVDTQINFASGITKSAQELCPPAEEVYLCRNITIFENITCYLATAKVPSAKEDWIVLGDQLPSAQTFALYGQRFGGIESHLKDCKSAAFEILDTHGCPSLDLFSHSDGLCHPFGDCPGDDGRPHGTASTPQLASAARIEFSSTGLRRTAALTPLRRTTTDIGAITMQKSTQSLCLEAKTRGTGMSN